MDTPKARIVGIIEPGMKVYLRSMTDGFSELPRVLTTVAKNADPMMTDPIGIIIQGGSMNLTELGEKILSEA
jgi:hypothetical protein